jgi:ribosomal-protein-serine acetyltransferase
VYLANADWGVACLEIVYFVVQNQPGKDYVTKTTRTAICFAFELLQVRRVELQCSVDNEKSIQVAQRSGFTLESCLRQSNHKKDDTLVEPLWFGLRRSEYLDV